MNLAKIVFSIVLFGFSILLIANGWQDISQFDENYEQVPNIFGQICHMRNCFRPEWIGLGASLLLTSGLLIFFSIKNISREKTNSTSLENHKKPIRLKTQLKRKHVNIVGLLLFFGFGSGVYFYGSEIIGTMDGGNYPCDSDKYLIHLIFKNNTFWTITEFPFKIKIISVKDSVLKEEVTNIFKMPIPPFSEISECLNTPYTNQFISLQKKPLAVPSNGGLRLDTKTIIENIRKLNSFIETHSLLVEKL